MKTATMKGCAKDGIEDIKTLSKQQNGRKERRDVYVLIISRLFRYGCLKCWCQVLHHKLIRVIQLSQIK